LSGLTFTAKVSFPGKAGFLSKYISI